MDESSELGKAVPTNECNTIPDNPSAVPDHQKGHILRITPGSDIDYDLWEVFQRPYLNGSGKEKGSDLRIPYFPSGFTVGTVLSGDLREVSDADEDVVFFEGEALPDKTAVHVEFCDPPYGEKAHTKQRRTPKTRGTFATVVAEEIDKILKGIPEFPYTVDEIKVLSIDVRSRGTVQPRIFVTSAVKQTKVQV